MKIKTPEEHFFLGDVVNVKLNYPFRGAEGWVGFIESFPGHASAIVDFGNEITGICEETNEVFTGQRWFIPLKYLESNLGNSEKPSSQLEIEELLEEIKMLKQSLDASEELREMLNDQLQKVLHEK